MSTKLTSRPQKLKPSDGALSRDDVAAWDYNHQAYCRQVPDWLQFLPGGTRSTWIASDADETQGLSVYKPEPNEDELDEEATNKLRGHLKNFLACLAIHSPNNFMEMVIRESTSYAWVIDKIKATFNLNTRGENFLEGSNLKFEFGPDFTYQQAWMQVKDFYTSSLLPAGSKFMGKTLDKKETLSPLAHMFLVKEWLSKIHPDLPDYIMKNESHLFTPDRPTLACNQQLLCDKMDSLLQKIENRESPSNSSLQIGNIRTQPGSRGRFQARGGGPRFSSFGGQPNRPFFPRQRFNQQSCYICLEAGRTDAAQYHTARDCRNRFQPRRAPTVRQPIPRPNQNFKVFLVQNPAQHNPTSTDLDNSVNNMTLSDRNNPSSTYQGQEVYEDLYLGEVYDYSQTDGDYYEGGASLEEL